MLHHQGFVHQQGFSRHQSLARLDRLHQRQFARYDPTSFPWWGGGYWPLTGVAGQDTLISPFGEKPDPLDGGAEPCCAMTAIALGAYNQRPGLLRIASLSACSDKRT